MVTNVTVHTGRQRQSNALSLLKMVPISLDIKTVVKWNKSPTAVGIFFKPFPIPAQKLWDFVTHKIAVIAPIYFNFNAFDKVCICV